jgi:hypothetical protein
MPAPLRFFAPLALDFEIRERARKQGRTISDLLLRIVESSMGKSPPEMPEAIVDVAERNGKGTKAVAAYLSQPLASAIRKIADEERRSTSWVVRSLIRDALRQRGLLPAVPN